MRYAVVRAPRRLDGRGVNFAASEREQISSGGEGGRWNGADFDLDSDSVQREFSLGSGNSERLFFFFFFNTLTFYRLHIIPRYCIPARK